MQEVNLHSKQIYLAILEVTRELNLATFLRHHFDQVLYNGTALDYLCISLTDEEEKKYNIAVSRLLKLQKALDKYEDALIELRNALLKNKNLSEEDLKDTPELLLEIKAIYKYREGKDE